MKSFKFDLPEPIMYATRGEPAEGTSITCYAPKPNQRKKVMKLKQMFFQSLPKSEGQTTEKQPTAEDTEITGDAVLFVVAQSNADYSEFIEIGRSILCEANAKVNDEEYLTTVLIDKLDLDVMEDLIGQYVANFIVKSALKSLGKN